ncbi:MAG TPA: hypothetical protein VME23_21615 [Terracidiphilus sp.]|nr:hypothetical protein [Terracidiphilus sp.]
MKQSAFQVHKQWLTRAVLVLVATGLTEGVVAWFAQRPILWTTLVASTLPVTMIVFVLFPELRKEARRS